MWRCQDHFVIYQYSRQGICVTQWMIIASVSKGAFVKSCTYLHYTTFRYNKVNKHHLPSMITWLGKVINDNKWWVF